MGDHVHLFYFETLAEIPEEEQYLDRLRENSGPCTLLYLRVYVFHAVIDFFVCTDSLNKAIKSMWGRTIRVLVVINMEHIIPVFFATEATGNLSVQSIETSFIASTSSSSQN